MNNSKTSRTRPRLEHARSRVIILRDQSSSMAWVPSFPDIWNEQLSTLSTFAPDVPVTLYSVNSKIRKIEDDVALHKLDAINPELWYLGKGGMLSGGTALGDAIIRGCQKAKQLRRRGHTGSLGLFLLTDGWSKNDLHSHSLVRKWLRYAREDLKVSFKLFGFVHPRSKAFLQDFCTHAQIKASENRLISFETAEQRDESMVTSLERLGDELGRLAG